MLKTNILGIMAVISIAASTGASAQTVLSGNYSVDGKACIGPDCTSAEFFGTEELKIKDETPRILFEDTSTGGNPSVDWMLVANSSAVLGADYFAISNADGGRQILKIEAAAPANSLYLDGAGELGLGTSLPQREIHMKGGDAQTIRFEQDTSQGNFPQTWDLLADDLGFSLINLTNSKEILRVRPGTGNGTAFSISGNGDVGMGTFNPTASLHITGNDGTTSFLVEETSPVRAVREMFRLENNGPVKFVMENTSTPRARWRQIVLNSGDFRILNPFSPGAEFTLTKDGNLTISGRLVTGTAGSCTAATPCDAVFDPDAYIVPSIADHAALMWENRYLPAVGPTRPEAPVDVTAKLLGVINELEHAHIYIAQQEDRIARLEAALEKLLDAE